MRRPLLIFQYTGASVQRATKDVETRPLLTYHRNQIKIRRATKGVTARPLPI